MHGYGWYLCKYVSDTFDKGATPIICSPFPRKMWKDGKLPNAANHGGWAKQVAQQERISFIDLNEIIARRYEALGEEKVEAMFADPHTPTSRAGAELRGVRHRRNEVSSEEPSGSLLFCWGRAVRAFAST